eukprot:GHVR01103492.1.p1 GENE.GHVR01103492.1~~GHVR01103492.1.p1  ORF type:complete len:137 (-),score=8.52 GHVR01103492.1:286-696(-)
MSVNMILMWSHPFTFAPSSATLGKTAILEEIMSEISKLTELRKLLLDMEQSMGLQNLSSVERDIYYAASDYATSDHASSTGTGTGAVKTTTLRAHRLLAQVSRPTFFRGLKSLLGKGYLEPCKNSTRGYYIVKTPR